MATRDQEGGMTVEAIRARHERLDECSECDRHRDIAAMLVRLVAADRDAQAYAEAIDNVRQALGLSETHYLVIADDVRDLKTKADKQATKLEQAEAILRRWVALYENDSALGRDTWLLLAEIDAVS